MGSQYVSHLLLAAALAAVSMDSAAQTRPRRVTPGPAGAGLASQSVPAPAAPGEIRLEGELVEVPVVVSDRSGHYVPWLKKTDFRIFEDGVEQEITHFLPETVPFHVAIVIDTSSSTRDTIGDIQSAALTLVNQLGPEDKAIVIAFSDVAVLKTRAFTNDKRELADAVLSTVPIGRTKLYDSVYATVTQCLRGFDGRKAMVILSDGQDTASHAVSFDEAANVCRETDIVVYGVRYPESNDYYRQGSHQGSPAVHHPQRVFTIPHPRDPVPDPYELPPDYVGVEPPFLQHFAAPAQSPPRTGLRMVRRSDYDPFMEEVAKSSGGVIFYAETVTNMGALCAKIAEELRHVYTLGYQPRNPMANGGHRRITVAVPTRPGAAIRHRLGYTP